MKGYLMEHLQTILQFCKLFKSVCAIFINFRLFLVSNMVDSLHDLTNIFWIWFWQYSIKGLVWHLNLFSISLQFILVQLWNHTQISSWNQPVLSDKRKVSCLGFKPTTDRLHVRWTVWMYVMCELWTKGATVNLKRFISWNRQTYFVNIQLTCLDEYSFCK